ANSTRARMTSRWAAEVERATLASTSRSVSDITRGGAGADILHSTPRQPNYLRDTPLEIFARPLLQQPSSLILADRAVLHAVLQQESIGPADRRPRRDSQQLHNLLTVEVGADLIELLLLGQLI